jgi:tetratricopeptide (TPR) repeat protein
MFKYFVFLVLHVGLYAGDVEIEIKNAYGKSYTYEALGNYAEAIKVLAPLYAKYPKGYTLNLRMAWLFFLDKKYQNAEEYYKKAILTKPNAINAKQGLISVHLATFSFTDAEQLSYEVLKKDYYNYYANMYAIQALIGQKKYDEALAITQKMLSLYPSNIAYLELLAVIYKETNYEYLHELYENILILDPNNVYINHIYPSKKEKTE